MPVAVVGKSRPGTPQQLSSTQESVKHTRRTSTPAQVGSLLARPADVRPRRYVAIIGRTSALQLPSAGRAPNAPPSPFGAWTVRPVHVQLRNPYVQVVVIHRTTVARTAEGRRPGIHDATQAFADDTRTDHAASNRNASHSRSLLEVALCIGLIRPPARGRQVHRVAHALTVCATTSAGRDMPARAGTAPFTRKRVLMSLLL